MPWIIKDSIDITKCGRCGKEIAEDDFCIKMTTSDPFRGSIETCWCEECYREFKEDLEG